MLVLKGLVGLHRTIQLHLLHHYCLGLRLGLVWYWMVCLGNKQRSFCRFWDCILITQLPAKHTLDTSLPPEWQDPAPFTSGLEPAPPTGKPAQPIRPASSTRGQRTEARSLLHVYTVTLKDQKGKQTKHTIYHHIKENKIPRNKPT